MSGTITINGLGSGLDYSSWIEELVAIKQSKIDAVSAKVKATHTKESTLSTVKGTFSSLLSSIEALNSITQKDSPFSQKKATSSATAVGASVDPYASAQNIKVTVSQLATATSAQSSSVAASAINTNTKISEISAGAVNAGTMSIYVNNKKYSINVTADETLGTLLNDIQNTTKVDGQQMLNASVDANGVVSIKGADGVSPAPSITIGASSDTSNLSDVLALTKDSTTGAYASSKSVFTTNSSAALTSTSFANGPVKAGTFTIGNAQFTITSTTTMNDLVTQINKNKDAGVSAYWDSNSGKLNLESTGQGAVNINIEAGTSNFTDVMGLTNSTWDSQTGAMLTTKLADGSQTLGSNAKLTINGTSITSSSNTITSDVSGITGLTLTLNDKTTSTATIAVTQDTSAVEADLKTFVDAFNNLVATTDSATQTGGDLHGESLLNSLRNKLRSAVGSASGDGTYKTLASIGISTGKIGTSVDANTNQLTLDTATLQKALANDPDAVKKLLLGDGTEANPGVMSKMQDTLDSTLGTNGYFAKRGDSYNDEIGRYNDKIERMTLALDSYQKQLETKFAAMDKIISNMKNQASTMDSYLKKLSGSS